MVYDGRKTLSIDTWEPIHHLPGREVVKYYERRHMSYPNNVNNTFAIKRKNGDIKRISSYEKPKGTERSEADDFDDDDRDSQVRNYDNVDNYDQVDDEDDEKFVLNRIITHRVNKDKRHKYPKLNRNIYRVRQYGYSPSEDTSETVEHLPRSKLLQYFKRNNLSSPSETDDAVDG